VQSNLSDVYNLEKVIFYHVFHIKRNNHLGQESENYKNKTSGNSDHILGVT